MVSLGLTTLGMVALHHLFPTLRARHAHGHRISLSKNGLELTRIDGRTDMIPWKAHPYLKEIRQGYAIIALKGQEDLHYPIDYLPMSMRQLERLLKTFSSSTRLRNKLSSPEALNSVLTVLEPTEEELTDSWTWDRHTAQTPMGGALS